MILIALPLAIAIANKSIRESALKLTFLPQALSAFNPALTLDI